MLPIRFSCAVLLAVQGATCLAAPPDSYPAPGQESAYLEHGFQMALVDYDMTHPALVKSCKAAYPDTAAELSRALDAWKSANLASQLELQSLYREKLGVSQEAMSKQVREMSALMAKAFSTLSPNDLPQYCNGSYANITLNIPEMNFKRLLIYVREKGIFK